MLSAPIPTVTPIMLKPNGPIVPNSSPINTIFSIEGKGLKLHTAQDVQSIIADLAAIPNLAEIRLSGNTFGVEAGVSLAAALKGRQGLKVFGF